MNKGVRTIFVGMGFVSMLMMGACAEDTTAVDCEATQVPAFAEVSMWPSCTGCHATSLEGADRVGAPEDINFDDYTSAKTYAETAVAEVEEGAMPPSGTVTDAQTQSLNAWVQCGTPE